MKSNTKSIPNWVKRIATYITLMFCYFPAFAYTSETWARISNTNTGKQYVYFLVDTKKKEATVISPSNIGYPAVQYSGKIDLQENVSAYVEGYGYLQFKVTAIGNNAFMGTSLTEIIIPQTVKEIGDSAFKNCGNLRDVIICGRNCNYIGSSCFQGTSSNIFWFNPFEKNTSGILCVPFIGDNAFTSSNHIYVFNSNEYKNHFQYNFSPLIKLEKTFQYSGSSDVDIITELPSDIAISIDKTTLPKNCGTHTGTTQVDIHYRDALHWSDYNDSFTESYNINITKAPLQFDTGTYERFYGDANPIISYSAVHGFVNGETINDLTSTPTFYSVANEVSEVGVYPIQVRGEALNYTYSCTGSLYIKPAPLEVTVQPTTSIYGEEPNFKFALNGLKNGEMSPVLLTDFMFSGPTKLSDVGEYVVQIQGGQLKNYEVLSYINGIHTITKAPLTLTAKSATRLYYEENPQFDFSLEGLRNSDDETCITTAPQYACSATMESDCGIYDIVPSGADAKNYDISYKPGQLTINPALLTLKVNDISREYGDVNPAFTFYCIGIKGEQTVADALSEQPTLVTSATEASNVGQYSVLISGGKSKNYQLSYQSGLLTVNKAPLTVVAENAEKTYGDMNPSFSRSYLGFRLADTESTAFSQLPKLSCTAMQRSEVGTYPITVTGGITKNYEIVEYTPGVLTVTKAPLTLTANNATRPYYEENPQFDFSLDGLRNGDGKSVITQLPIYTCDAAMSSNAGIYSIIPSSAQAKNYDISYKNGQLSITKRTLSASAPTYSRYYGEKNPDFEISYSGFVNGEDFSVLTAPVIANCTADETSDVGTYPITLHGGDAINYEVKSYTSGKLTIEKANQTITWNQDLSNITMGTQIALNATSSSGLPVSYEMSPNNVATLYSNSGTWYLDCYASGAVSIRANHAGDKNHNPSDVVTKTLVVFGGGGSDPSNPQIYLHIEDPGTLPSLIAENRKYQIKNLRLSGYLNGTDINYIREMAGSDAYGNTTAGVLELLDISSCTIVPGGRSYFSKGTSCYTTNNYIGDYMFYNCKVLTNLLLPSNATVIEDYAFADCSRLSVLSIPNGVTLFGTETFRNDIGLLRIPMPENLTSIGDKAFMGCNNLTEIDIPANVFYIGDGIVKDCENISRINVDASNQYFASKDGVLFDYEYTTLKIFPVNNPSSIYKVMNGVTRIAPYSFVNAKKLTEVTLPSSLLTIGTDAFIGCVNLNILHTEAIAPPVCDNDCFESVSKTRCELQVPQGCYNAYWVAPVWSEFNKIVERSSSINDVSRDNIEVSVDGLNIMITGTPNDIYVRIYQMNGLLIYQQRSNGENISYQLATPGTYIVAVGNKTFKILVK